MANISFFFPKAEKGNALAINAGMGNLGVSVVQFVVPVVITAGVFGALGGDPQTATVGKVTSTLWLQNAGFVFVPFIVASAFAAWFGMNDIATMKASFADQSVIFRAPITGSCAGSTPARSARLSASRRLFRSCRRSSIPR